MPGAYKPAACSTAEREQIRHELVQLTKQIDYLEMSEHDRLARELQAVELNIQEAERQKEMVSYWVVSTKILLLINKILIHKNNFDDIIFVLLSMRSYIGLHVFMM